MAGRIEFNRSKFKELVVYLAQVSTRERDEGFGMVKLNKLLYRADFEAFRLLGHAITGETYEKQEFGPVARSLPLVLDELAAAGRLQWESIPRGPHIRQVPTAADTTEAQPDLTMFSAAERDVVENTLRELATYGGKSVSEWSHQRSAGWNLAREYGQAIDYDTAFVSTEPIPPEDLERARKFLLDEGVVTPT
jgi:uncharacterized phage-associated protein